MNPTIALFTGDPAGIGPELVDKLLADPATLHKADIVLIGQRDQVQAPPGVRWHDWEGLDAAPFERGQARADNGRFMLQGLEAGARLAASGADIAVIQAAFAADARAQAPAAGAAEIAAVVAAIQDVFEPGLPPGEFLTPTEIAAIRESFNVPRVTEGMISQ